MGNGNGKRPPELPNLRSQDSVARLFIYAVMSTMVVALVTAVVMMVIASRSYLEAMESAQELVATQRLVLECRLDVAKVTGRLMSFEAVFVSSHQSAVVSAIDAFKFEQGVGGPDENEPDFGEFVDWFKRKY